MNLREISTTYEVVHGDYVYRFIVDGSGTFIKRTLARDPLWGHGIMVQGVSPDMKAWVPIINSIHHKFVSLDDAVEYVKSMG